MNTLAPSSGTSPVAPQTRVAMYLSGEFDNADTFLAGSPRHNANRLRQQGWMELVESGISISLLRPGTNIRVTLEPYEGT